MESSWKSGLSSSESPVSSLRLDEKRFHVRWIQRLRAGMHTRRRRLVALSIPRALLLTGGVAMGVAVLVTTLAWHTQMGRVASAAHQAALTIDDRLHELTDEATSLALGVQVDLDKGQLSCSTTVVGHLLRASLSSNLVQRWSLQSQAEGWRCGPEGLEARLIDVVMAKDVSAGFVMQQSRDGALMWISAPDARGHRIVAELDHRALLLPADGPWARSASVGLHLVMPLPGGDKGAHSLWNANATNRPSHGASAYEEADVPLEVMHRAPVTHLGGIKHANREAYDVEARVVAEQWQATQWAQWPLIAALTALLTAAILGGAWSMAIKRSRLVGRLETALHKRQFEPWVQPIVDLQSGHIVGAEVLMRWLHPHRGVVGPGEFIAVAERTGLIGRMSAQVSAKAAMQLAPLVKARPSMYISFNITPWQLRQSGFAASLHDTFRDDSIPQSQVLLELTERDLVDATARATLFDLRANGWRIAIDDFGTGHSSLAALESLPVDRLKIDRAFVSSIGEQSASRPVLDAVIAMARQLGISLIAEGIETKAQWDYLREQGVGSAQGFMIAKPMPIGDFGDWLVKRGDIDASVIESPSGSVSSAPGVDSKPWASDTLSSVNPQNSDVLILWDRMVRERGVDLRDRMHLVKQYAHCFVASEAVDWLVSDQHVSRREAVRIGRHWVARGLIRHVVDEHDFDDANLFFTPRRAEQAPAMEVPTLHALLQASRVNDQAGPLPIDDHADGLILHRRCVTGRALINWILSQRPVSRAQATQWARAWMQQGRIHHVYDDRGFEDGLQLYRLG
jgi:EAL domain-containing protein (putative c-di-GMP-specific phosphodiesterase class I)